MNILDRLARALGYGSQTLPQTRAHTSGDAPIDIKPKVAAFKQMLDSQSDVDPSGLAVLRAKTGREHQAHLARLQCEFLTNIARAPQNEWQRNDLESQRDIIEEGVLAYGSFDDIAAVLDSREKRGFAAGSG